jgi:hypothetical protein
MPVISYFNLNKIYILNSAFFLTIIFVGIIWMHVLLHTKIMTKTNNVCDDPVARFFNKKAAEKCILEKMRKDTMWIETKFDNNVVLNNDKADEKNVKIVDLIEKYRIRNEAAGLNVAESLYKKNEEVLALASAASNIKTTYSDTETNIKNLYNDYLVALRDSIDYIKKLADKIALKLSSNIYVKKKSYKKTRKSLSKSYDNLAKRMKTMFSRGIVDPSIGFLSPLTYSQRNGKK